MARAKSSLILVGLLLILLPVFAVLQYRWAVIEEPDRTYLAETDTDGALRALQAASCTYRIALGPSAGRKVLSVTSPDRLSTTNGSNVTVAAKSCCN